MILYQDTLAAGQSVTLDGTSNPALAADSTVRVLHNERILAYMNASDGADPVKVYEKNGAGAVEIDVVGEAITFTAGAEDVKLTVSTPD